MNDRFQLGVATAGVRFFSGAVLDSKTGLIYPFSTLESAEDAIWAMCVDDREVVQFSAGYHLTFVPLEEIV